MWISGSRSAVKRYELARMRTCENTGYVKIFPFDNMSGSHYVMVVRAGYIDSVNAGSGTLITSMHALVSTEDILTDLYGLPYQDSVIFLHNAVPPQQLKWISGDNFTPTAITFMKISSFEFSVNDVSPSASCTPSVVIGFIAVISGGVAFQGTDVGKFVTFMPVVRLRITKVNSNSPVSWFLEENLFNQSAVAVWNWTIEGGWGVLWGAPVDIPVYWGTTRGD
jgi:hypothetical protein